MRLRITVPVEWPDADHIEIGLTNEQCAEIVRRAGLRIHCPACGDAGGVCGNCGTDVVHGTPPPGSQAAGPTHQQLLAVFEAAKRIASEHGPFCSYSGGGQCDCGHPELHAALRATGGEVRP